MNIWFTSDTHFFHKNIIEYCRRPYYSVDQMNQALIDNWNRVVEPDDIIYHLGDFSFANKNKTRAILEQLYGYKVLIRGNHDRNCEGYVELGFNEAYEDLILMTAGEVIWMNHIPEVNDEDDRKFVRPQYKESFHKLSPNERPAKYNRPSLVLCGHVHEKWLYKGRCINVGVDQWGYFPVSLKDLIELRNRLEI